MKRYLLPLLFIWALSTFSVRAFCQSNTKGTQASSQTVLLSGTVRDENGKPISGCIVSISTNKTDGFCTDTSGHYQITIPTDCEVTVSFECAAYIPVHRVLTYSSSSLPKEKGKKKNQPISVHLDIQMKSDPDFYWDVAFVH
jgi:hypothetical protein